MTPVRGHSTPSKKTAIELPHDLLAAWSPLSRHGRGVRPALILELTHCLEEPSNDHDDPDLRPERAAAAETVVERARRLATPRPIRPRATVARVLVTPAMAMDLLDNANTTNCKVSDAHVQPPRPRHGHNGADDEGIALDPSGILLDGQHRLGRW